MTDIADRIMDLALARVRGGAGRNDTGKWLADQLRDNRVAEVEAGNYLQRYQAQVTDQQNPYTWEEARASLRQSYKASPREPWTAPQPRQPARGPRTMPEPKITQPAPTSRVFPADLVAALPAVPGTPGAEYLDGRGGLAEIAAAAGVTYADPDRAKEIFRAWWKGGPAAVVFPFLDADGRTVAAQARALVNHDPKSPTEGPRGQGAFFALDLASLAALPAVAIAEGPIDALTLAAAGLPALATGGNGNLAAWLVQALARPVDGQRRALYMAQDADDAGRQQAEKMAAEFHFFGQPIARLRPPFEKDWNAELTARGLAALRTWLDPFII